MNFEGLMMSSGVPGPWSPASGGPAATSSNASRSSSDGAVACVFLANLLLLLIVTFWLVVVDFLLAAKFYGNLLHAHTKVGICLAAFGQPLGLHHQQRDDLEPRGAGVKFAVTLVAVDHDSFRVQPCRVFARRVRHPGLYRSPVSFAHNWRRCSIRSGRYSRLFTE